MWIDCDGWLASFSSLLGTAHVLAAILGTPGCEMRAFAHLRSKFQGGDAGSVPCPGGIDRFDHVGGPDPMNQSKS